MSEDIVKEIYGESAAVTERYNTIMTVMILMDSGSGVDCMTKVPHAETELVGWLPVQSGPVLRLYSPVWIEQLHNRLAVHLPQ